MHSIETKRLSFHCLIVSTLPLLRTDPPEEQLYAILDVEKNIWIFEGSIENMMSFKFDNGRTLGNNFSSFIIEYIL